MRKVLTSFGIALAIVLTATSALSLAGSGPVEQRQPYLLVGGTIRAIDSTLGTVTIATPDGPTVTVSVHAQTLVYRNGAVSQFASLQVGDIAKAAYDATGAAAAIASMGP